MLFREILATDSSLTAEQAAFMSDKGLKLWVCEIASRQIGHCAGLGETGEIVGLSVDEVDRRRGIGTKLLTHVVASLRSLGCARIWVEATADPTAPAYRFYRAMGWLPTGKQIQAQSFRFEVFECPVTPSC
jgi:ribosomal protein S18 acetylase RimI-like enzyme